MLVFIQTQHQSAAMLCHSRSVHLSLLGKVWISHGFRTEMKWNFMTYFCCGRCCCFVSHCHCHNECQSNNHKPCKVTDDTLVYFVVRGVFVLFRSRSLSLSLSFSLYRSFVMVFQRRRRRRHCCFCFCVPWTKSKANRCAIITTTSIWKMFIIIEMWGTEAWDAAKKNPHHPAMAHN